jgi:hypothetical protein
VSNITLYQIFYNEATLTKLDPAFVPLDNSRSARPDWYEYWPIRSVLGKANFTDDHYLGFFSPRFREKTGFTGADVHDLVARSGAEVVGFSPEFDWVAVFQNAFFQGDFSQRGLLEVSRELFEVIGLGVDPTAKWADQTRTIFANYFVAKYAFWKEWFVIAEQIFRICEDNSHPLAEKLTSFALYRGIPDHYQMKIFVMERLVNAILERRNSNADSKFNFTHQRAAYLERMARMGKPTTDYKRFLLLDALKGQYIRTGQNAYLNLFQHYRSNKA